MAAAALNGGVKTGDALPVLVETALIALFHSDDFAAAYAGWRAHQEEAAASRYYAHTVPLDTALALEADNDEPAWLSDEGRGVARILSALEGNATAELRRQAALKRVRRTVPHCLKTLQLVMKNGKNRRKSICEIAGMR